MADLDIYARIRLQASYNAAETAIVSPDSLIKKISYRRLTASVDNIAARLARFNLAPGAIVGVHVRDSMLHAVMLLALLRCGYASLTITSAALPNGVAPALILMDDPPPLGAAHAVQVSPAWFEDTIATAPPFASVGPSRIMTTSGSTGRPKAVRISSEMLAHRVASYDYAFGAAFPLYASRLMCFPNFSSSLGYAYLLYVLQRGGTFFMPSEDFGVTVETLNAYGITALALSPITLRELVNAAQGHPALFDCIQAIFCAGGRLAPVLADAAARTICPRIVNIFGSTELGASATSHIRLAWAEPDCAGNLLPDVEAAAFGNGMRLAEGARGLIGLRTAHGAVDAYVGVESDAEQLVGFRDGWFFSGDYGRVENGRLYIEGRETNVLNFGGDKIAAERIEELVASIKGVRAARAAAVLDDMGVGRLDLLIEADALWAPDRFWDQCRRVLPAIAQLASVGVVTRLPQTAAGKLDRTMASASAEGYTPVLFVDRGA